MATVRVSVIRKSQPIEFEVGLDDQGQPVVQLYSIKELTGADRDSWLSEQNPKIDKTVDGKSADIRDYDGLYSTLLKYCLYDPQGKLVPEDTIQTYPGGAQEALHAVAVTLNGLDKNSDDSEKK
jgi:hypothetical protein